MQPFRASIRTDSFNGKYKKGECGSVVGFVAGEADRDGSIKMYAVVVLDDKTMTHWPLHLIRADGFN